MQPTDQQKLILDHDKNAVVIAAPGSGKTFVISEKIRSLLRGCKSYQGVIAISYTNKASGELKERCLRNGFDPKGSFFGTIDKFYIREIVIPFGKHFWGIPKNDVSTVKFDDLSDALKGQFDWVSGNLTLDDIGSDDLNRLGSFFSEGFIILESVSILANYIIKKSNACRKYIKARYMSIFIDEYQDCGDNQHRLFENIVNLGLVGVAVGDLNQSIYGFSGKSSKFLISLTKSPFFRTFKLDKNHRCTPSIINYSNYLLNPKVQLLPIDRLNVKHVRVAGNEVKIAEYIDSVLPKINALGIKNNQIAVLTRGTRTADIVNSHLKTPHRLIITTDLDMNLNIWSGIFSNLLRFAFDPSFRFVEVIQDFVRFESLSLPIRRKLVYFRDALKVMFSEAIFNLPKVVNLFIEIAETLAPNSRNRDSIALLAQVLNLPTQLDAYRQTSDDEIVLMTLHKSKGLEFDVIFHLDLYDWVFPQKSPGPNRDFENPIYGDYDQDLNLHYVGVTRARKACYLISSTQRTNADFETRNAKDSEFLWKEGISNLRL